MDRKTFGYGTCVIYYKLLLCKPNRSEILIAAVSRIVLVGKVTRTFFYILSPVFLTMIYKSKYNVVDIFLMAPLRYEISI